MQNRSQESMLYSGLYSALEFLLEKIDQKYSGAVGVKREIMIEHLPGDAQKPADVAVVIQTVLRPSLLRTVRSVFNQDHAGRIQVLIGIDRPLGDSALLEPSPTNARPTLYSQ